MILVTGADGLLGSWLCYRHRNDVLGYTRNELDVTADWEVDQILKNTKPDAVINCAGIVKSRNPNPEYRMDVNGKAPHALAKVCDIHGVRLIQMSTDCVFRGDRGDYTESDEPDADDNYGWTKAQGEVVYSPHLTVRTSFVGWPDPKMRGLLAWLFSTSRSEVPGYKYVLWDGLTVLSLADYLLELAYSRQTGVMHLYGQTTSKYHLLQTAQKVYGRRTPKIEPVDTPVLNRTLASVRTDRPIIPGTSNFEEQMWAMKEHQSKFTYQWHEAVYE